MKCGKMEESKRSSGADSEERKREGGQRLQRSDVNAYIIYNLCNSIIGEAKERSRREKDNTAKSDRV